jgi:mannose/cellobiose epimerase-like protein (N-acyl-D-glucosamine 2-epimerase family)
MLEATTAPLKPWRQLAYHRAWLLSQARALFDLFGTATINPRGGFYDLDDGGHPIRNQAGSNVRQLHATSRMIFCYAVGHKLGHPGSSAIVEHGMDYLWSSHRDQVHGGYCWGIGDEGPVDATKQAYGHAFVLLAAASAKAVGHPDAGRLMEDVRTVLLDKFWEPAHGASAEEFSRDWAPLDTYRGQNSNMHLTEALMAAFEVTGDQRLLGMAESIADLLIRRITAAAGGRLPEHFFEDWTVDQDYAGSEMFRPAGTTPGHWLEWSRLLVQLWLAGGKRQAWMPQAASALFRKAVREGWDGAHGGFFYTLDHSGRPLVRDKIWWPACEAIGAATFLADQSGDPFFETWYREVWNWSQANLLDREHGGWRPQLDEALGPKSTLFTGRPDIYHALQACLIPLYPAQGSLLAVV